MASTSENVSLSWADEMEKQSSVSNPAVKKDYSTEFPLIAPTSNSGTKIQKNHGPVVAASVTAGSPVVQSDAGRNGSPAKEKLRGGRAPNNHAGNSTVVPSGVKQKGPSEPPKGGRQSGNSRRDGAARQNSGSGAAAANADPSVPGVREKPTFSASPEAEAALSEAERKLNEVEQRNAHAVKELEAAQKARHTSLMQCAAERSKAEKAFNKAKEQEASANPLPTGGNSPQVASAYPPAVQEKSAIRGAGANQRRGGNHQHPRADVPKPSRCRNGSECFALLGGFCKFYHTEADKAAVAAAAVVARPPTKLCEKGTKENCDRYMGDHTGKHVCKKHHADTLEGVDGIYLSPNTWGSNHVKYVEALEAKATAEAEANKVKAEANKVKADVAVAQAAAQAAERIADDARNWAASANREVDAIGQRLMHAEATLASVGIVPVPVFVPVFGPVVTGCHY
jgi:hypothetical protein